MHLVNLGSVLLLATTAFAECVWVETCNSSRPPSSYRNGDTNSCNNNAGTCNWFQSSFNYDVCQHKGYLHTRYCRGGKCDCVGGSCSSCSVRCCT